MLQMTDTGICETSTTGASPTTYTLGNVSTIEHYNTYVPYTYWKSYPVYVCTDKTKKAIKVLKALQAEKLLKCDSVPRFIALVEKISNLL